MRCLPWLWSLSVAGSVGCATLPLETGSLPKSVETSTPVAMSSEVAPTVATVPPDAMTPGGHYQVRLTSEAEGQPGPVVHGRFVRYEGDVSERAAVFEEVIVEMRSTGLGATGVPIVAKVPYVNRLFKNVGSRTAIDFSPSAGEKRVPLGSVEVVTSVSAEKAVRLVEERSSDGPRMATLRTQVVRDGEILSERIGVDFDHK
jgi:hypothetical protein